MAALHVLHQQQHQHLTLTLRFSSTNNNRPPLPVSRRTNSTRCSSSSSGRAPPGYAEQQQDIWGGGMLSSCLAATARLGDAVVSRLADALQSVAPAEAPRHKIEVSVKGALVLLLLGLLKGVISFVLLVGCVGLAAYTATQVFGLHGVVLGQTGQGYGGSYRQPPDPTSSQEEYQQQQQGRRSAQTAYRQWQQQQQSRGGWPGRPSQGDQGDMVDVYHFGRPAPQQ